MPLDSSERRMRPQRADLEDIKDRLGDRDVALAAQKVSVVGGNIVGGTGGTSATDKAGFAEGSGAFTPVGGVVNDTPVGDVAEDAAAAARITPKRGVHANLRSNAGAEVGTSTDPLRVDPTGTTAQPVSGPVTDAQLRASAVPVSGPLTDGQLRATAVPVSGPLTDSQIRASAVPVSATSLPLPSGAATAANQSTGHTKLDSLLTELQAKADLTETQPVSVASLPLPSGAATETSLAAVKAKTDNLDLATTDLRDALIKTGANSATLRDLYDRLNVPAQTADVQAVRDRLPAVLDADGGLKVHVQSAVPVTDNGSSLTVDGPLTDGQLRANAVPVSGPLTDSQLRATAVPVSGPVTDTQLRASPVAVKPAITGGFDHGRKSGIGTTAVQVLSASFVVQNGVLVKAAIENGGKVFVGNSDVTNDTTDATDGFELSAGESCIVPIDNVNKIYVIGSAAGQKVFWLAA